MSNAAPTPTRPRHTATRLGMRPPVASAPQPTRGRHARPEPDPALDAATDVVPVVPSVPPAGPDDELDDGRRARAEKLSQPGHEVPWGLVGAAAVAAGCSLFGGSLGTSSAPAASTPHTPVAGEFLGTSALGCDVESMGLGAGSNATFTDPVCTRAAIIDIACSLDVRDVAPVERYYTNGSYYLWADPAGSMAQFRTTVSSTGSTTEMTCQSGGRIQQLDFTGDEWNQFNGVGTLSDSTRSELASA